MDTEIENENLQSSGSAGSENSDYDFQIPEEYQNKGWVKPFNGKKGDELKSEFFRSYDNSQTLIGKKVEDYIKSVDLKNLENYDEIKETLQKQIMPESLVPEDAEEYNLGNIIEDKNAQALMIEDDTLNFFKDKFKELGLSVDMGQKLFKTYIEHGIEEFQRLTNADELENNISEMFRNNKEQRGKVESLMKEFLPKEDLAIIQQSVPNRIVEMFYKIGKGLVDKYEFKESGTNASNPVKIRMTEADKNREYERLTKMLDDMDNNPYQKVGDRQKIVSQLRKIFE